MSAARPPSLAAPARRLRLGVSLIAVAFSLGVAHAQLPVARLTSLFPPGGRAGSTVEVAISGADLDDVSRLVFSHTNIITLTNTSEKFVVSIPSDVPVGIYDARVVGRYGISNPRAFVVGDQNELIEAAGNSNPGAAMEVAVGSVANGRADSNSADYFKLALKGGERVFIQCAAQSIDSRCQPVLALYDDAGRELARNRRGSLLDFTAARDMTAVIKLHDLLFRGGPEYHYRLSITTGPHIDFVLPVAVLPGATNKLTAYGRNLPGGSLTKRLFADGKEMEALPLEIAAPLHGIASGQAIESIGIHGFHYRLDATNGVSNPAFISLATGPVLLESEPNSKPAEAQNLTPPCEVNGQFHPGGDQDWFAFNAKKGDAYWIEVFSERLALPTDPFLLVQRVSTNGSVTDVKEVYDSEALAAGDLKADSRDPGWRLEVSEDGVYRVQVRDLFNRIQADPSHVYRMSIRPDNDGFELLAAPETPIPAKSDAKDVRLWPPILRRGDTLPVRVTALRRGYAGNIELSVQGLPSGVTASPASISAGKNFAMLLLTAAEDAPGWAGSVKIIGMGKSGKEEIKRVAGAPMVIHPVEDKTKEPLQARLCDSLAFAVSQNELAPLAVTAADDKVYDIGAAGKLSLPLRIHRRGDFTEAFKLKPGPASAIESLAEFDIAAKATNATVEIDVAKQTLAPGEHVLFFRGQAKGKYRRNPEAASLAEGQLKDVEKRVSDLNAEIKKSESALATLSSEAKAKAEKHLADLKAKLKDAESHKAAADAAHKKAVENAKPREVMLTVYSSPVRIRVLDEKKGAPGGTN